MGRAVIRHRRAAAGVTEGRRTPPECLNPTREPPIEDAPIDGVYPLQGKVLRSEWELSFLFLVKKGPGAGVTVGVFDYQAS